MEAIAAEERRKETYFYLYTQDFPLHSTYNWKERYIKSYYI